MAWGNRGRRLSNTDDGTSRGPVIDQIRGRVVERRPDPELKHFDAMSRKYIGNPGFTATRNLQLS